MLAPIHICCPCSEFNPITASINNYDVLRPLGLGITHTGRVGGLISGAEGNFNFGITHNPTPVRVKSTLTSPTHLQSFAPVSSLFR